MNKRNKNKNKNRKNRSYARIGGKNVPVRNGTWNDIISPYLAPQHSYTSFENFVITGIDPHKYMSLKYVTNLSVNIAAGVAVQQTFNLNSIFDPDRTGVGHQPYLYDQMAALYNRYRVLHCFWKISYANNTGSYNAVVLPVNGLINTAITTSATYETAAELPFSTYKLVPGTGGFPVVFRGGIALNKLNGTPIIEYMSDDRTEAQVGASPTEILTLVTAAYNPTLAAIIVNFTCELRFIVDFHDPISLAGS